MGVHVSSSPVQGATLDTSQYVHLHNHTHHSLLDGLSKIPLLVDKVKEMGMDAVGITDHGTMSGEGSAKRQSPLPLNGTCHEQSGVSKLDAP